MNIRRKELWKVPVFCIAAGFISFYGFVFLLSRFGTQTLPDGSIQENPIVSWTLNAIFFALTLLIGWRLFRKLSRKELFWSATILVVPLLILVIVQLIVGNGNASALLVQLSIYHAQIAQWGQFISQLLFLLTKSSGFCAVATVFLPYIFILFGRKQPE